MPQADLPSYKPLVVPPNTLRPPPGIKGINTEGESSEGTTESKSTKALPKEAQIVEIPFTDIEVPMPTTTIMTTAATTAFISVAATLTATSLFKYIVMLLKPVFVASVFTGALATFGLTTSNTKSNTKSPDPKKKEE
jgi:hypothetical protein